LKLNLRANISQPYKLSVGPPPGLQLSNENPELPAPVKSLGHQRTKSASTLPVKGLTANPVRVALTKKVTTNFGNTPSEYVTDNASNKSSEFEVKPLNTEQKITSTDDQANVQPLSHLMDVLPHSAYGLLRPAQRALPAALNKPLPEEPINGQDGNQDYFARFLRKPVIKRTTTVFREVLTDVPSLTAPGLETNLVACSTVEDHAAATQSVVVSETHDESIKPEDIKPEVVEETSFAHDSDVSVVDNHVPTKLAAQLVHIIHQLNEEVAIEEVSDPGLPKVSDGLCSVDIESFNTESHEVDGHPPILARIAGPAPADGPADAAIDGPLIGHASSELELYVSAVENQDSPATRLRRGSIDDLLEAWDEEEEYFDAENYSIARYDNTTGTSMIVPEPRFTARTAQELAHARDWVEENTCDEEIEEESWDMTLVTEYGDEIFAYLRKVEVCFATQYSS
jgi:hypothetical protein